MLIDEWLPPAVRERQPFPWLVKLWLGARSLPDFKERAFTMTDTQYIIAYQSLGGLSSQRESDITENQIEWLLSHAGYKQRSLEIGPGSMKLANRLREQEHDLTMLDLGFANCQSTNRMVVGVAERLPFRDKSFETTIITYVLEHVRSLTRTALELERVTRDRVLIITPRQRYNKVTFDYHLHFFYSLEHLASHLPKGQYHGKSVDGSLCLVWQVDNGLHGETMDRQSSNSPSRT
jgi:hypothetical protein